MEEYEEYLETLNKMRSLSPKYRNFVIESLMHTEDIDIPQLITVYSNYLKDYKQKSRNDIRKLSQAGMSLLEKPIKKIKDIKNDHTRNLHTAFANTIISGGGYFGSEYHNELLKHIDMKDVDIKWYEDCWKLETINVLEKKDKS